jgi:putative tryptophan/tyrosine transport system substrate-binding protein
MIFGFSSADFRLWMRIMRTSWVQELDFPSGNPKSKIAKPKWLGLSLIAFVLAMCAAVAHAQQSAKIPKIGFLGSGPSSRPWHESFKREFRKLGYVDGKNVMFIHRFADTKYDRLPVLADELVRLNVDVIITPGSNDTAAAKNATKTIPIVFLGAGSDPVVLGLVDSLARPGGNLTGVSSIASELAGKRLELLKETVPKVTRVGVLWNPQNAGSTQVWKESQPAAKELNLQLHSVAVNSADQLDNEFKEAVKARSGALVVTAGALLTTNQVQIINLATKYQLPALGAGREFVANGGLMSYGTDPIERYQRAALMVEKILKGAKPADLPVEQPTKFELVINLKTAKTLGLMIPQTVLARTDRVIK